MSSDDEPTRGEGGGAGVADEGTLETTAAASSSRPVVLPEPYDGTGDWSDWCWHFENVAEVNGWDDTQKLQWLRVRITGRAQKVLHRLTSTTYEAAREALQARFEPDSRHTRYLAEFQSRRKKPGEGWADFAEDVRTLADKAYPTLQEEARERLSINAYLAQLPQPQIAFSVRQKQPDTLDEAVAATLEMESYLQPPQGQSGVSAYLPVAEPVGVGIDSVDRVTQLTGLVEKLAGQVEKLQLLVSNPSRGPGSNRPRRPRGACWNCQQYGHQARNCPLSQPDPPPNPPGN